MSAYGMARTKKRKPKVALKTIGTQLYNIDIEAGKASRP